MGLAYFAAVLSMIGDWFRVISKKTKEEVRAVSCVKCHTRGEAIAGGKEPHSKQRSASKNRIYLACSKGIIEMMGI